jgi:GTPase SAR1 family protein
LLGRFRKSASIKRFFPATAGTTLFDNQIIMGGCDKKDQTKAEEKKSGASDGGGKPQPGPKVPPPPPKPQIADEIPIRGGEFEDHDCKILTLGAGECGKSTIWRQLKLVYCGGFDQGERESMKQVIKINVISDIKTLIDALKRSGQSVAAELSNSVDLVSGLQLSEEELIPEVAAEITQLWNDPIMKVIYQDANSIGLGDNASFFLDNVVRIADPKYVPTDEDILKSRIRTTGIASLNFFIDNVKTDLVDVGGQKSERSRWQRCFHNVDFLMFVVSLSDFDQCMFEDEAISRTKDSMELFGSIANSAIFKSRQIFLVLNKVDIFKKKLALSPEKFRNAYQGFSGDVANIDQAIDHVKKSFIEKLNSDRSPEAWVEAIPCCAMDKDSIRALFQKIGKKVLEQRRKP